MSCPREALTLLRYRTKHKAAVDRQHTRKIVMNAANAPIREFWEETVLRRFLIVSFSLEIARATDELSRNVCDGSAEEAVGVPLFSGRIIVRTVYGTVYIYGCSPDLSLGGQSFHSQGARFTKRPQKPHRNKASSTVTANMSV